MDRNKRSEKNRRDDFGHAVDLLSKKITKFTSSTSACTRMASVHPTIGPVGRGVDDE